MALRVGMTLLYEFPILPVLSGPCESCIGDWEAPQQFAQLRYSYTASYATQSPPTLHTTNPTRTGFCQQRKGSYLCQSGTRGSLKITMHPHAPYPLFLLVPMLSSKIKKPTERRGWLKRRIVEVFPNRQYMIRMDHSGRVTLQNRKFIKQCHPITPPMPIPSRRFPDDPVGERAQAPPAPTEQDGLVIAVPTMQQQPEPAQAADQDPQMPLLRRAPKIPRALENLAPFNKPGAMEEEE